MERVTIDLLSVVERDGRVRARARATTRQARIMVEITFQADSRTTKRDL